MDTVGGLRLEYGTYYGDGTYGTSARRVLTFSGRPLWVFIKKTAMNNMDYENVTVASGGTIATVKSYANSVAVLFAWGTNSLTIYGSSNDVYQLNQSSMWYFYIAVVQT